MFLHLFVCLLYLQGVYVSMQWGREVVYIPICNGPSRRVVCIPTCNGARKLWSGQYASYWNASLFNISGHIVKLYLNLLSFGGGGGRSMTFLVHWGWWSCPGGRWWSYPGGGGVGGSVLWWGWGWSCPGCVVLSRGVVVLSRGKHPSPQPPRNRSLPQDQVTSLQDQVTPRTRSPLLWQCDLSNDAFGVTSSPPELDRQMPVKHSLCLLRYAGSN